MAQLAKKPQCEYTHKILMALIQYGPASQETQCEYTQDKALIQYGPASQETQCEYTHKIRH